jgi:hypothetical protein
MVDYMHFLFFVELKPKLEKSWPGHPKNEDGGCFLDGHSFPRPPCFRQGTLEPTEEKKWKERGNSMESKIEESTQEELDAMQ